MNVAALLQETPSEDVSARRARSGSTAAGNNPGQAGPPTPLSQPSPLDRERERERERDRDVWGRGRPPPPPSNAGLRSLVHSPVDPRSNPPDSYRTGPPPHIQSSPSSSILGRGQPPLSPAPSLKDSKIPANVSSSPSSSRASGPQAYGGPHGHPHSSHPSPAMGSLRPNAALASGASQTSVNSGIGGGEAATGWPGPGYGGPGRERRGSASSGIGVGGGLLRSNQPHPHHSSHSPVFDKEYHQQQPGARRKTISSGSGPLGGSATNSNIMPPPSQLVGPGTGTPPDDLPPLTHKSSSMAPPMSHPSALPPSMHGLPPPATHQHSMSSSSFMERERDILLNREPRDHPMDHLRPSSTPAGPPASNPIGTPRQFHAPPSAPTGPRGGPPTSYSQPGSGRVTPINDLERDRERDRIMYNREREHQHQRERTLSSASASAAIGPSPMTSPRGVQYGPPPPPGHHPSQSLPPPPNPGQAGSPLGSGRGPPQSPHIHPASGASHAPPANPYAAASSGFGHSPYGPPPSSASGHGPPHPPPSSAGPLPPTGPARDRERERDREFERERERTRFMDRDRDLRDREFQRDLREREQRDRELNRDRELRERELRERDREAAFREREIRERERDMREREDRDRERARDRDIIRDVRPDPRDMREARDIPGVPGGGRPDPRDPRELRPDPRDFRPDPRADPYRERDLRVDHRERERRDPRGREHEWERKEREKEDERIQWEKEQERERREREQREHREQANRERDLKEKEAREREARDKEREQIMIMREKQREKELRDRERLLRERERQETKRDGEGREGVSRNPTIIIGPGVPPPAPSSMQREAQRGSTSQPPPAAPSANPAGPHPPQSHHQGRFNTAFISNFAGPNERGSRNSSRVGSPNPATLGSQMSTINMSVGSAPTIGPGVPGPVSSSVGGMHIIPGGMLGGGIPSQMPSGANDPKGRVASAIPLDRRDRDGRDVADSKEGIRERERERERDRDRDREIKPAPMPTMPTPSNTRAPGVLPKEQPQPAIRDRERERERERELYAAAIAGGNSAIPPANSRRHGEGEHHGHSRHSSLSQQQQQQQQHQRERERERDRERETRRHQSGPYPHPYDEIPGPRERERERERINIVNAGQIPPSARDGDVEMGYGYPPPPHHSMGPPPPPAWNDGPAGPTSMEMGYPGAPPGSHHPMPHHPPPPSQSYAGYHPPPHGPYPVGPPLPGYGPSPPPGQPGYGQPHPQQYGYDDRGMAGPVDMNGIHHAPNGVVVPSGNGVIGHPMPPGPPLQQQQPHHPPQHVYSVPPGYMPMSTVTGLAHPGPQQGSGLLLPTSTLALAASSPLESPDGQLDMVRAAEAAALLQVEQEKEYERRPEVKAKTTINLGTFVYPDLPFPYNFDLGGGITSDTKVVVQENPEKKVTVVETKGRKRVGREEKAVEGKAGSKENAAEEGEIAESAKSTKEKAPSPVVKEEPTARTAKIPVIDLVSDDAPPKGPARESCTTLESNLDVATKVDDVEIDVETRVAVIVPHGHLPDKKPTKPRIWGGGISPAPHIGPNSKPGPSLNGRTNEPSSSRVPKMITRDSLIPLLPTPPRSSLDTPSGHGEEWRTYITQLEAVGRTILTKYAPRRIYTDDSDVALCAIHSGWVSWDGVSEAKRQGRDLRVEVKVMRVSRLGSDGQWSGREVGKLVEVQSYGKGGKGSAADRERREEVVTRFTGGLGERCWSAKGRNGWIEVGEASDTIDEDPLSDGRALMSAAWGTGHDGAAIEILSASFVERGTSRKAPGLGRRNRAQRMLEYAERRMTVLGQPPQQQHPLLRTIAKGNINPRFVSSLTASPWNFTTTILAGRKRRRGYGCVNTHPPINAKLPNATLLEAINELDERERDKGGRGAKRQRTGSLSEVVHLPGKTQEEWREDTLMNLKTVVFATNTVPPPVTAEDSYPTSPTSPAGQNPITAGLLTAGGSSKKDSTIADSVRVGYKYDRIVLKQILFPSDPLPPASNSLKTSPAIDKEKALLSHFLGTLPRRQVILETATKERYLLAPRRADGSFGLIVPDARKVRWAYDISLILEQEVIVEEAKDDLSANVVGELPVDVLTSPDEAQALTTTAEVPQVVEPVQDSPKTASEVKADAPAAVEEKEEGELESNDPAEERLKTPEPPPTIQDKDGDVEMGDGDKEPGELNEDEEKPKTSEVQPEVPQVPVVLVPSPSLVASPHPPVLKLDTINLTPSRAPSRVHSKMNSPVNPQSSVAPSAVGPDVSMDAGDEEVEEESFVTLIRGEDEDGNEQSVHYPVQMLQRHVTEGMLRFEKEGIYVKEAAFVGPTVPPSPSTSVPDEADGERMDVVEQGPGGQPTEWRMQVVSWKWAGQAWGDY